MGKAERIAQTDYKKALMGSSYDKMFPGRSSMVNKDVFASFFGTTDYYYDLAKNTRRMVILDKVRVVQNIALNTTNPYAKLPPIFKKTTVCYDMDDFIKALACQESGIIAYGTNEADEDDSEDEDSKKDSFIQNLVNRMKEVKVMFDFVITNPPYSGSLHLSFFELGINHMRLDELGKKCGQMTIIEPATWLINVRKYDENGKYGKNVRKSDYKLIENIKAKIAGHVKKVVIENLNKEFSIRETHPLSVTYVDFSQTYDTIEFECCGEKKVVKSIYDCNLIGSYDTIWNILNKVLAYGDMMDNHTTSKDEGNGYYYLKYFNILTTILGQPISDQILFTSPTYSDTVSNGTYMKAFIAGAMDIKDSTIYDKIPFAKKPGPGNKVSDHAANCVYGTKEELENWKHFIFNNKLPLFINIVLTIDQNNNSKEFLPWLVDKQYTDEEIYAKFNLTKDEIALIDKTLKKFERSSPWFKRYACGLDADSTTKNFETDVADIVKGA